MKKKLLGMGIILACVNVGTLLAAPSTISIEKAKSIALSKIPGGTVSNIELDYELGRAIYEVEVLLNQFEYDLKLDAKTGSGISLRKELRDGYIYSQSQTSTKPQTSSKPQAPTLITSEQAKAAALKKVPGATVLKIELDLEDGVYELELRKGYIKYDVTVGAYSGQVFTCEIDD